MVELQRHYPSFNRKSYLFVGRLGQEKSVDILIRGVGEAVKKDPEIQLFLAGEGPAKESLASLTDELGLPDDAGHVNGDALKVDGGMCA